MDLGEVSEEILELGRFGDQNRKMARRSGHEGTVKYVLLTLCGDLLRSAKMKTLLA